MADRPPSPPSLQSLLKEATPTQLNKNVTPTHLSEIASKLITWQLLVPHLSLTQPEEEAITRNYPGDVELQRLKVLQKWSEKQGSKATYKTLIRAVYKVGKTELAEYIIHLLNEEDSDTDSEGGTFVSSVLETYTAVVKKNYRDCKLPTLVEWPVPPTFKFLQLAMIKKEQIQRGPVDDEFIQMTLRGNVDDILHRKVPVQLEQIFSITDSAERKVILIEGAPGCGKTTLLWHICQKWGEGSLFHQFKLAVLVQLRDPAIHSATSFTDILPFTDKELCTCQDVATEIRTSHGDGLLILLDGWDEAPNHVREASLFRSIILNPDSHSLGKSAVIVSSRPSSSLDLHPHVSARIEVIGFTPPRIEEYVKQSLSSNPKEAQTLIEKIRGNPHLQESCYLPLYLAIVTHVFMCMGTLPPTYCGIIMMLVLSCLKRYIQKGTCNYGDCGNLTSFDKLPSELSKQFSILCKLAFKGVINDKYSFSTEELDIFQAKTSQTDCAFTLGLMQAVESFVAMGKSTTYHFLHVSIQEFCAAKYISTLPNIDDHIGSFQKLTDSPRLWPILEFYSMITKLADEKIRTFLISLPTESVAVSQCRCLYEAQDASLCPLLGIQTISIKFARYSIPDLMAVSYFISHSSTVICLQLIGCNITATGAKVLADGLKGSNSSIKQLDLNLNSVGDSGVGFLVQSIGSIGLEKLALDYCNITAAGAKVLADGLKGSNSIRQLELSMNSIGDSGVGFLAQSIGSTGLEKLDLSGCKITTTGAKVLADSLRGNSSIKQLNLSRNFIGDSGVGFLAQSIGSTRLEKLDLSRCKITATGAKVLADGLRGNSSIKQLNLNLNSVGDSGVGFLAQSIGSTALEILELTVCDITATGAKALADELRGNEHLKVLELQFNAIGDVGSSHLAEVLRTTRLEKLQLFRCGIGDEGIAAISSALTKNPSLTYLGIAGNSAVHYGLYVLAQELARNTRLSEIELCTESHFSGLVRTFISNLKDNNSLTKLYVVGMLGNTKVASELEEVKSSKELASMNSIRSSRCAPLLQVGVEDWLQIFSAFAELHIT